MTWAVTHRDGTGERAGNRGHSPPLITHHSALIAPVILSSMSSNESIDPGWRRYARYTFPPAVRRGDLLFISGLTAVDDEGNLVGGQDIAAQARYIYARIAQVLEAAGGSVADIG